MYVSNFLIHITLKFKSIAFYGLSCYELGGDRRGLQCHNRSNHKMALTPNVFIAIVCVASTDYTYFSLLSQTHRNIQHMHVIINIYTSPLNIIHQLPLSTNTTKSFSLQITQNSRKWLFSRNLQNLVKQQCLGIF